MGVPYVWGGENPEEGFDCSGYVQWVLKESIDFYLPRTSKQQHSFFKNQKSKTITQIDSGDILFFKTIGQNVSHVAIAINKNTFIHAPNVDSSIRIDDLKGYWKDKNNTEKVIINGWLHTGDLGFIDDEGYIKISGRMNEMIVNSGGENIAPVPIENLLLEHEEIEQTMVYGHNKPFLIALLVPNENLLNSNSNNVQNLTTKFQGIINNINKDLSPTKRIRKFIILEKYFTIDNNMLTPTLKIKRNKISSNYYNEIQKLYNNSNI